MDEDESSQRVRMMAPWELGPPSLPQRVVKGTSYGVTANTKRVANQRCVEGPGWRACRDAPCRQCRSSLQGRTCRSAVAPVPLSWFE